MRIFGIAYFFVCFCVAEVFAAEAEVFELSSTAFENGGMIPATYSRLGENISPPLTWHGAPQATKSYALIMIDYDAEKTKGRPIIHWVVYDMPSQQTALGINATDISVGLNSYNKPGYIGMNPPVGEIHHYYFDLYALSIEVLSLPDLPSGEQVLDILQKHCIAKASLVGKYQRKVKESV